jgi:hypothetical protein
VLAIRRVRESICHIYDSNWYEHGGPKDIKKALKKALNWLKKVKVSNLKRSKFG